MFPQRLLDGYRTFLGDRFARERGRYESLAELGQSPEILVVGCCDSRVSPEVIFDASPGELLIVRNVANLVPPFETGGAFHGTSAALEFAVAALKVKHIVVLGHARCGGIRAFADRSAPLSPGDFIGKWMSLVTPAAERLGPPGDDLNAYLPRLERAAIENSLANLMTFPCVRTLVERGRLNLHGAFLGSRPAACWCAIPTPARSSRRFRACCRGGARRCAPSRSDPDPHDRDAARQSSLGPLVARAAGRLAVLGADAGRKRREALGGGLRRQEHRDGAAVERLLPDGPVREPHRLHPLAEIEGHGRQGRLARPLRRGASRSVPRRPGWTAAARRPVPAARPSG